MARGNTAELRRILDEAFGAFEAGDDDRARRLCREALAIDPDSSTAHSLMGLLYEREGRTTDATREFEQVVTRNPSSEAERQTLERMRPGPGGPGFADEMFDDPVEQRPDRQRVIIGAVAALVVLLLVVVGGNRWLGKRAEAAALQQAAAELSAELERARTAYNHGDYETAFAAAGSVLQRDPANQQAQEIQRRCREVLYGQRGARPGAGRQAALPSTEQPTPEPAGAAVAVQSQPAYQPPVAEPPNRAVGGTMTRRTTAATYAEPPRTSAPNLPTPGAGSFPSVQQLPPVGPAAAATTQRSGSNPYKTQIGARPTVSGTRAPGYDTSSSYRPIGQAPTTRRPPTVVMPTQRQPAVRRPAEPAGGSSEAPAIQPPAASQPSASTSQSGSGNTNSGGYLHVEVVKPDSSSGSASPAPEVVPREGPGDSPQPQAAPGSRTAPQVSDAVRERHQRQQQLQLQRERQDASGVRLERAEQEQQ